MSDERRQLMLVLRMVGVLSSVGIWIERHRSELRSVTGADVVEAEVTAVLDDLRRAGIEK